jgi:hypothetical protein
MIIEIIHLSDDSCSETLLVIMFRYLIWYLYSLINPFLQVLIIINASLIGEWSHCETIEDGKGRMSGDEGYQLVLVYLYLISVLISF